MTANFYIYAGKGQDIIINQLESIYNNQFKDSHSHPIQICFPIIASNEMFCKISETMYPEIPSTKTFASEK